ncbi:YXWGXW repeat-containing protein [Bordetella avium]|uniref:Membrane protein n=1 Tax=Bordetella avium (strain 197N) TaxID=360910 RepID=Q2L0T2_BORA1|nr:YXWGXW repeat-containing protein [Bordetella avium]AZY52537.1 hypothetical protein C0J07_08515 [Bordetella avium]RIQ48588.1 hypothetical protein D0843_15120 [Bordetella avium]RIQ71345.1 hypothetical protein D0838_11750 [Bordetella avium]CAJ49435.1 putative membrane protein [Bordetella avium 197N]
MTARPSASLLMSLTVLASVAGLSAQAQVSYDPPEAAATPASPDPAAANLAAATVSSQPPPALPVYQQPPVPGDGYLWMPGYWARNAYGFYWVPGAWVIAPYTGALWTPGYWAFDAGVYRWHPGYWGPHIGYYGGINYGFGYIGIGYVGGYWRNNAFFYNRSITNVNLAHVTNVYHHTVVVNNIDRRRVSYNGGPGGLDHRPSPQEEAARADRRTPPTQDQMNHARWAGNSRAQWAGHGDGPRQVVADTPLGSPRPRSNSGDPATGSSNPNGPGAKSSHGGPNRFEATQGRAPSGTARASAPAMNRAPHHDMPTALGRHPAHSGENRINGNERERQGGERPQHRESRPRPEGHGPG